MNLTIVNHYRPPSSDIHSFEDIISHIREQTSQTTKELVLIGDLNFPDQFSWTEGDKEGLIEAIQGRHKGSWGRELTQAIALLKLIEESCLSQQVQEETRKNNILDLLFTNSMTMRGTKIMHNSSELSNHNMVVSTFITAEKTDSKD